MFTNMNNVKPKWIFITTYLLTCGVKAMNQTFQNNAVKNVKTTRQMFDGMDVTDILKEKENGLASKTIYEKLNYPVNFTAPGRRISETKCLEFIWKYKLTELLASLYIRKYIIGGRRAKSGEFPHMGALGWRSASNDNKWIFKCGASLISERFMLTTAHCHQAPRGDSTIANTYPEIVRFGNELNKNKNREVKKRRASNSIIPLLGSRRKTGLFSHQKQTEEIGPKYVPIKRFINHKDYKSPKHYYDIAIIELEEVVDFSPISRPACLWTIPDTSGLNELLITGWGIVDLVTRNTTAELQVAKVNLIEDEVCDVKLRIKQNRNWRGLADHQLCAGVLPGGVDTCEGDSGGPIQIKKRLNQNWPVYFILGVTSFGYSCAQPDMPGIYVKTSSFIDWIESTVWPDD